MNRDWMTGAACRNHLNPELWFPSKSTQATQIAEAVRICMSCPVIEQCDQYRQQTRTTVGIWGGNYLVDDGRASTIARHVQAHGTVGGYQRHRRRGEKACLSCRAAATAAARLRHDKWQAKNR